MTMEQKKIAAVDYDDCLAPTTARRSEMFSWVKDNLHIGSDIITQYYERSKIIDDFSPKSFAQLLKDDGYRLPDGFENSVESFFIDPEISFNEELLKELQRLKSEGWELRILSAGNATFQRTKIAAFLKKNTDLFNQENVYICPKASDKIRILSDWYNEGLYSNITLIDDRQDTVSSVNTLGMNQINAVVHKIGDTVVSICSHIDQIIKL